MNYIRKADLYKLISNIRCHWGLEDNDYDVDVVNLCQQYGIKVGCMPFETRGLRGIASVGDSGTPDVIILNSYRNKIEQNIDCAHESIHLAYHRNEECKSFNCFDIARPSQNKFLEWQANEGSAELLVPYKTLLPKIKKCYYALKTYMDVFSFKSELVQEYHVTDAVISYRLESLKFEIEQYVNGIDIHDLRILSYSSQINQGINVKSLNDVAIADLSKDFERAFPINAPPLTKNDSQVPTKVNSTKRIVYEWKDIVQEIGGLIKAVLRDSTLEECEENYYCIVFRDVNSFSIGNRQIVIDELKKIIFMRYGEEVHIGTRLIR